MISQFLNNEPRYLEPMLDALESWSVKVCFGKENATPKHGYMVWEESFIMLLWLSHLLLAPFDLSSMSSDSIGLPLRKSLLHVDLPATIPPIAQRLVRISTYHLNQPSKARETAGTLLVRLTMRADMRRIGLHEILVDWALSFLRTDPNAAAPTSIYGFIGILSFLAGFIVSTEHKVLSPLLPRTYTSIQHAKSDQSLSSNGITSSASARKLIIKVERALAVAGMKNDSKGNDDADPSLGEGALEDIIDHLLTALEDKDTPVRLAASKGLSVIAVELEPDMVAQIIDAIEEMLYEDTSWQDAHAGGNVLGISELRLEAVSATKWHGLILALAQLIFRGSMPPKSVLGKVMLSLTTALCFEQRSSLGTSVGTSVRDAACFGLWALARRYTTAEINSCKPVRDDNDDIDTILRFQGSAQQPHTTENTTSSKTTADPESTLQTLANELVLAATLDVSGNIRRGASAALQEMIGRHPEEIKYGIDLVQVVDYHGIALRSRAMTEIAISVSRVDTVYWDSILRGLLDWRGVRSGDAECRRSAAHAIGLLAYSRGPEKVASTINTLRHRLAECEIPKLEERHGLLLALSEVVDRWSDAVTSNRPKLSATTEEELAELWHVFYYGGGPQTGPSKDFIATDSRHLQSALTCEAVCSFVAAFANSLFYEKSIHPSRTELRQCCQALETSLRQSDSTVIAVSTRAASALLRIFDHDTQDKLVIGWARMLSDPISSSIEGNLLGVAAALGASFQHVQALQVRSLTVDTLVKLVGNEHGINLRCVALRSLTSGVLELNGRKSFLSVTGRLILVVITERLSQALHVCLNDYTTDRRGDIGSLIRLEAIDATAVVLRKGLLSMSERRDLAARICGLAVEKLDRIRFRAWGCLQTNWEIFDLGANPHTYVEYAFPKTLY